MIFAIAILSVLAALPLLRAPKSGGTTDSAETMAAILGRAICDPSYALIFISFFPAGTNSASSSRVSRLSSLKCARDQSAVRFVPAPCPYRPAARAPWQLRGMATDPSVRGSGAGRALVTEGLARVAALGGDLVWCDARTTAVGFYERLGFTVVSGPFDKAEIGPHVGMLSDAPPPAAGASRWS